MNFRKSVTIDAPLDKVWQIAATDFHRIELWASSVHSSEADEHLPSPDGAEVGGRVCATDLGDLNEHFAHFDDATKRFTVAFDGLPFFVRDARNAWRLRALGPNRTEVVSEVTLEFNAFPGSLLGPLMRGRYQMKIEQLLEELQHFAEHGAPHPRKVAALAKRSARTGRVATS